MFTLKRAVNLYRRYVSVNSYTIDLNDFDCGDIASEKDINWIEESDDREVVVQHSSNKEEAVDNNDFVYYRYVT